MTTSVAQSGDLADDTAPRLIIAETGGGAGGILIVHGNRAVLGRSPDCDLRLDHPHVSGTHALLRRSGGRTLLKDMSSTNGTWVNSVRIKGTCPLSDGDLVRFGSVEAVFREPGSSMTVLAPGLPSGHPRTHLDAPPRPVAAPGKPPPVVRFTSDKQQAGQLNNVGGNQYNQYLQQIRADRESFLREIAGTRTKARWMIVVGFVLAMTGFAFDITYLGRFFRLVRLCFAAPDKSGCVSGRAAAGLLGPVVLGMPLPILAVTLFAAGAGLTLVGLVLHIVAASRRRFVETALGRPLPPMTT